MCRMGKYWFKHDHGARNDPKLQMVLQELGHEGKSIFWDLIEMLYEQGGKLPLSECKSYAFTLRTSLQVVLSLINDFDIFQNDGTSFWNDRASSRIVEFSEKSEKAAKSVEARWERQRQQQESIRTYNDRNTNVSKNDTTVIQEYRIENIDKENNNPLPPTGGVSANSSEQGKIPGGQNNDPKEPAEWMASFEIFWEAYGKRRDRSKCERRFKNLSKAEREAIFAHVPKYVASTPEIQYRKNPLTYLNGKCWEDEDLPPVTGGGKVEPTENGIPGQRKYEMVY